MSYYIIFGKDKREKNAAYIAAKDLIRGPQQDERLDGVWIGGNAIYAVVVLSISFVCPMICTRLLSFMNVLLRHTERNMPIKRELAI